jgi:hypothetical protein
MASAKDEVSRRTTARLDPRADPDSVRHPEAQPKGLREEVAPRAKKRDPRAEVDTVPAMRAVAPVRPRAEADTVPAMRAVHPDREKERLSAPEAAPAEAERASQPIEGERASQPIEGERASQPIEGERASQPIEGEPASQPIEGERASQPVEGERPSAPAEDERPSAEAEAAPVVETKAPGEDARFAEIDRLLDRTAWKEIAEKLGPPEREAELPPALGLVYALARREAAGDEAAPGATALAIKSMAALLGVPADSVAALLLAKRLLRQNPATWRTRPAPRATVSVAIVVLGVALGIAAGSFLSLSAFKLW